MKSTFKLRNKLTLPNGTKQAIGVVLVSTGLKDIDNKIGGGISIGSVVLIENDSYSHYSSFLLKYFLSEGFHQEQRILPIYDTSKIENPKKLLFFNYSQYLKTHNEEVEEEKKEEKKEEAVELNIAFRYRDFIQQQMEKKKTKKTHSRLGKKTTGTVACNEYDISKPIQEELYEKNKGNLFVVDLKENTNLLDLYNDIEKVVLQSTQEKKILRIAICSTQIFIGMKSNDVEMKRFLYKLKFLCRSSLTVLYISSSRNEKIFNTVKNIADINFFLQSFEGDKIDVMKEFKVHQGFFGISKLAKINSICVNFSPDTLKYVFRLKKRKMYIKQIEFAPTEGIEEENQEKKNLDF